MGLVRSCAASIVHAVCAIAQVAFAVAIIYIVADKLTNVDVSTNSGDGQKVNINTQCQLGDSIVDGMSLCKHAYTAAGVSLFVTTVIGILLCCTCNCCGLGDIIDTLVAGVGTAWWAVNAALFTHQINVQDQTRWVPNLHNYRDIVLVLAWAEVAAFGIAFILGFCHYCCGACGGKRSDKWDRV